MSEDKIRYFLRRRGGVWYEVTKDGWLKAEYAAGFRGGRMVRPSTAAWSAGGVEGTLCYPGESPPPGHLPLPACRYGLTRPQAIEVVGLARWDAFCEWMAGQTMGVCAGEHCEQAHGMVFYLYDVERFLLGRPIID